MMGNGSRSNPSIGLPWAGESRPRLRSGRRATLSTGTRCRAYPWALDKTTTARLKPVVPRKLGMRESSVAHGMGLGDAERERENLQVGKDRARHADEDGLETEASGQHKGPDGRACQGMREEGGHVNYAVGRSALCASTVLDGCATFATYWRMRLGRARRTKSWPKRSPVLRVCATSSAVSAA